MFDWDRDQESIMTSPMITHAAPIVAQSGGIRTVATRWLAPVAVVFGLALAGQSVFQLDLAPSGATASFAASGGLRAALFQAVEDVMPAELLIYEEAQYAGFMRGIARYTDAELLEYAAATARDLTLNDTLMTPYLLDALWLINRQIERRGLSRPMRVVAYEAERESFTAAQQNL